MASFARSVARAMRRNGMGRCGDATSKYKSLSAEQIRGWGDIIVFGSGCTWWDLGSKSKPTQPYNGRSFPGCPHCGGLLFQVDSERTFMDASAKYEADGHPGYVAMMLWARGKCFKSMADLSAAYAASFDEPGKAVA